jgi:hypothetical protein
MTARRDAKLTADMADNDMLLSFRRLSGAETLEPSDGYSPEATPGSPTMAETMTAALKR